MGSLPPEISGIVRYPAAQRQLGSALSRLLDLVFPPRCTGCQRVGSIFCPQCLARVRAVPRPVCLRCGQPQPSEALCADCRAGKFYISAIRSAGIYTRPLSGAIQQFKYSGRAELRRPLGMLLASYWRERGVSADLVIAVPLHERRQRERGYNQAHLLASEFCRQVGLPLVSQGVLRRQRETRQQVLLGPAERRRNVAGAFTWDGPALAGLKALLIDDVATTGSTLEACGEALSSAGVSKVWALTAARSVPLALLLAQGASAHDQTSRP